MMFYKELYVFDNNKPVKAVIRNYSKDDFEQLIRVQQEAFPPPFPKELWWNTAQLSNHITLFPEGALCIEIGGRIAGSITGLIVKLDEGDEDHSWADVTEITTLMAILCTSSIYALAHLTASSGSGSG
jgi:hypothetical protein